MLESLSSLLGFKQQTVEQLLKHLVFFIFSIFWSSSPTAHFSCILFFQFVKACESSHSFRMLTAKNSLSTNMSSQVTASSHSSCEPTPVSPLSQHVSLSDNNSLAQAISMALVESLPSLLSSCRDSSGGNANMATTPGPLDWASNSIQSPTSLSSGTPCSTSQFSSTLVVPSYISTYNSFTSPSVVSTLPATSSTNLPVVVGGSCGGMTRSVSSAFPRLNKAFVVGPGCAPVQYKLVSTITARVFVHLADLLPDNIRAQEIQPQTILEGKLLILGSKKWVNECMRQLGEKNAAWRPPSRWLRSPSSYPLHQPCIFAS